MKKLILLSFGSFLFRFSLFSQNVGIGIPVTTRAKLEVQGTVGIGTTSAIFGIESTGISLQRNWPAVGFNQYNAADGTGNFMSTGYAAIQYLNSGTGEFDIDMLGSGAANTLTNSPVRALSIGNTGNVGIRTGPGSATLVVLKAGNTDGAAIFGGTEFASYLYYSSTEDVYIRGGKTGSNVYINDIPNGKILIGGSTSKIGINTSSPASSLEIRQTGLTGLLQVEPAENYNNWEQVVGFYNGGPESSFKMLYNGTLKCFFRPSDGAHILSSDKRIKTNIRPLGPILNKIMELQPVKYEMINNNPTHIQSIGFIAQDVQKLFPRLITVIADTAKNGLMIPDLQTLNYEGFKIIAIKGVQEEEGLLQDLQDHQNEMIKRLEAVEKKLKRKDQKQ